MGTSERATDNRQEVKLSDENQQPGDEKEPISPLQQRLNKDRIAELREARGWEFIRRQTSMKADRQSEDWKKQRRTVRDKLGTGFIIALVGDRGVGKTQIGADLMLTVTDRFKSAEYLTATGFFLEIKSSYHPKSELTENEVVGQLCRPSLLVLDEYEKRQDSEWENRTLFEVLNRRYGMMKDTLILSNLDFNHFVEMLGPSMASRINETGGIITCDWPSFRQ